MTRKKQCPVCGLVQAEALDCASCAASLIGAPVWKDPEESREKSPNAPKADPQAPLPQECAPASTGQNAASTGQNAAQMIIQAEQGVLIKVRSGDILGRAATGAEYFSGYPAVSRRHARLICEAGQWIIEDLHSANGVHVEGKAVQRAELGLGDCFSLSTSCELTVAAC